MASPRLGPQDSGPIVIGPEGRQAAAIKLECHRPACERAGVAGVAGTLGVRWMTGLAVTTRRRGRRRKGEGTMAQGTEEGDVLVDRSHEGVALVTLNRPHHLNALTSDMLDEIYHVFEQLGGD